MAYRLAVTPTLRRAFCGAALTALAALSSVAVAGPDEDKSGRPTLSLSAAATSEVAQDKVTITLAHEIEGSDQAKLSQQLNQLLENTLAEAKRNTAVTARSGNYNVWANADRNGRITGWRGRAELILESKDFVAASKLAGDLSRLMAVSNVSFSLSREAREAEEQRLLAEAANAFRTRATDAAKAFGFSGYAVKQLDLSGTGTVTPAPRAYAMAAPAMEAKAADLPLEGGKSTVTVSVRGTVYLQ
ncbi:MAG: SIMPL domain-containing protein [Pigmentiphaga sp.]|uniref:SIMPL domain-containing protein n=1 Tax=Pigmentiphaga sp. TaxID=1977564 RepID=UPI0029B6C8B9|nr:SIMPL domain-containing protein [Pigmentiphaga sp.]MDX3906549.1 SIMPL domain-containing protein [Pigmentiphaga sp.]